MRIKKIRFLLVPLIFVLAVPNVYCEDSTEAEETKSTEIPQWALYMRRTEIVTFGSLPFTTLGVTLGFGAYKYFSGATSSFPNPFDKSSSGYTGDDMWMILGISVSISAAIGIADLIVSIIRHNNETKRLERLDTASVITIVPATEDEINSFRKSQNISPEDENPGHAEE